VMYSSPLCVKRFLKKCKSRCVLHGGAEGNQLCKTDLDIPGDTAGKHLDIGMKKCWSDHHYMRWNVEFSTLIYQHF
ncbi:MAG TPA: hypothetical protein VI542_04295, partial [Candidatus Tectomicrobia bacterium]